MRKMLGVLLLSMLLWAGILSPWLANSSYLASAQEMPVFAQVQPQSQPTQNPSQPLQTPPQEPADVKAEQTNTPKKASDAQEQRSVAQQRQASKDSSGPYDMDAMEAFNRALYGS
ncbi:MAG TPA: hypothetical protein V6D19_06790 [Stenomitos sp.]